MPEKEEKTYVCKICEQNGVDPLPVLTKGELKKHEKTHTDADPDDPDQNTRTRSIFRVR